MHSANSSSHGYEIPYRSRKLPRVLFACLRGARVMCHIISGVLLSSIFPLLGKPARLHFIKGWSRKLLEVMHVGLETHGCCHRTATRGRLLVANHISWLDPIAMNAVQPSYFVAKSEVGDWPLLGWLSRRAHTLFIDRSSRIGAARINQQITRLLEQGESVALFPEGTTAWGAWPGHFHSSLLQGPVDSGAAIFPVVVRYHDGAGKGCADAAFLGNMTFIRSLWNILCSPSLHVTLVYLPAIPSAGKNRRMLASEAQVAIRAAQARISPRDSHPPPCSAETCA